MRKTTCGMALWMKRVEVMRRRERKRRGEDEDEEKEERQEDKGEDQVGEEKE